MRKCNSCRYLGTISGVSDGSTKIALECCTSPKVKDELRSFGYGITKVYEPDIETGREFCDREGDGVYVYYEPPDSSSPNGNTFDAADRESPPAPPSDLFVQITREPRVMRASA
jgi:hypothetical protein